MINSEWVSASRIEPCENCGNTKWCRKSADGNVVICQSKAIPGGIEKKDKNGETFWQLTKKNFIPYATNNLPKPQIAVADPEVRSRVYNYLIELLSLDDEHAKSLINRGLSVERILLSKFRTLPAKGRNKIYRELEKKFGIDLLKTIPGFVQKDGRLCLGGAPGILIPVYDHHKRITAILIRPDKIIDGNKYLWLSSGTQGGPSSGRHIHIPLHTAPTDVVVITEGALKAEVSTELSGTLTIGIPGISGTDALIDVVNLLNVKTAIVALDADGVKNLNVAQATLAIFDKLSTLKICVGYRYWELTQAKGLDDALLSKVETKVAYGEEARKLILSLPPLKPNDSEETKVETEARPEIHHGDCQMHELINATWKVVIEENNPENIFRNASSVVMLFDNEKRLEMIQVDQTKMFGHLVRIADWYEDSYRSVNKVPMLMSDPSTPPKDLVKDLLAFVHSDLPRLTSVLEAPTFGKNGQLVCEPGYNRTNGIYLDPKRILKIPQVVFESVDVAKKRISFLKEEVFCDFPFASETDFTHLIAILVTGIVREMIEGPTPLFIINATSPGSGKSLLAELVSLILTGSASEARAIPKSEEEMRKSITSELMRGPRLVLYDNADQESEKIHSPTLAAVLTSTIWTDRILSQSKMTSVENRTLWLLTGNNVGLTSELFRRSVQVKLEPNTSKPWERQSNDFKHANIKSWVCANRGEIMTNLLTICNSWVESGAKPSTKTIGSFEAWANIVGGIIEHIGLNGFLDSKNENYSEVDAELADWQDFTRAWWSKFKNLPQRVSSLYQICESYELLSSMLGSGSDKSRQTKLGIELKNKVGRIFGNYRVKLSKDAGGHGKFYQLELLLAEVTKQGHQSKPIEFTKSSPFQGDFDDLDNIFNDFDEEESNSAL